MLNYLLESSDHLLLENKIDSIVEKEKFQGEYRATYDLEEVALANALEDLDTYSFLSSKKVIIIKNILSSLALENEKKHLIKYLENPSSDNLLIMTSDKMDAKTFSKKLKSLKTLEYQKLETNPVSFAKNIFDDYKISNMDLSYLAELCNNDITKLNSECEKLMMYKIDTKEIGREDITNLVVKKLGDSNEILFSLAKAIMSKDKKQALKLYNDLKVYQIDANSIIGLMASQMKLVSQIKVLKEKNLNVSQIQQNLNLKSSYQVKKLSEYIYSYSYNDIKIFFNKLFDLDYSIKTGKVDSSNAIELLIINL
ncbi:MAG: DNA polymerase III subunit delta [bacterium]|nr:DNA polymerase III subunit delta [bacterium]